MSEVNIIETVASEVQNHLSLNPRNSGEFQELAGNKHRFSLADFADKIVSQEQLEMTDLPSNIINKFAEQLESKSPDFGPVAEVLDEIEQVGVEDYRLWKSEVYETQSSSGGTSVTKADLVETVEAQTETIEGMQRTLESLRNAVSDLLKERQ